MTTSIERARSFDAQERPIEAVAAYEEAIRDPAADLNVFLDLAVLYFVCYDFGYLAHHRLPDELILATWDGMFGTLDKAEERFGGHPEIDWWRMYMDFIVGRSDLSDIDVDKCEVLAATGQTLLPYMSLYLRFRNSDDDRRQQYRMGAERLLREVEAGRTERQRYLRSGNCSGLRGNEE